MEMAGDRRWRARDRIPSVDWNPGGVADGLGAQRAELRSDGVAGTRDTSEVGLLGHVVRDGRGGAGLGADGGDSGIAAGGDYGVAGSAGCRYYSVDRSCLVGDRV